MLGKVTGKKWATDEVHAFLAAWQYKGEDGVFYLRESLGPVAVQLRSSCGPLEGPSDVLKMPDLGPVESVTPVQFRSPRADLKAKEQKKTAIPLVANATIAPSGADGAEFSTGSNPDQKTTKRIKPEAPAVTFEPEDEQRVALILAATAAENKTGAMAASRVANMRATIRAALDTCGDKAWRYGLDTALSRGKPWEYASAVMRNNPNGPPAPVARPAYGGYAAAARPPVDPVWMADFDRYEEKLNARNAENMAAARARREAALGKVYAVS